MKSTKRKEVMLFFILALMVAFCSGIGVSYAYFSASLETTGQTISFARLSLNVSEEAETNNTKTISLTGEKLCEGDVIGVNGKISLESNSINAFVRIQPEITMTPETGKTISTSAEEEFKTLFINGFFALCKDSSGNNFWLKPSTGSDDNFYCYEEFSTSNSKTFKGSIPISTYNEEWLGSTVTIKFNVQAIQSKGAVSDSTWSSATTPQLKVDAISKAEAWSVFGGGSYTEPEATLDKFIFTETTATDGTSVYSVQMKDYTGGDYIIPATYNGKKVVIGSDFDDGLYGKITSNVYTFTIARDVKEIDCRGFSTIYYILVDSKSSINYLGTSTELNAKLKNSSLKNGKVSVTCSNGEVVSFGITNGIPEPT